MAVQTLNINSEYCGHTNQLTASLWDSDGAQEGQYTGYSGSRFGLIRFPTSLSNIDWNTMSISSIQLAFTFGSSGKSGTKKGVFWRSLSNSASGTASSHKGDALCNITFAHGYSSGGVETFKYTSGTIFDSLVNYLNTMHTSGIRSMCIYSGNTASSSSYSADYLKITKVNLQIVYEPKGILISSAPSTLALNGTAEVVLSNPSDDTEYEGTYSFGEYTYGSVKISAGGTYTVRWTPIQKAAYINYNGAATLTVPFTVTTTATESSQTANIVLQTWPAPTIQLSGSRRSVDGDTGDIVDSFDGSMYRYKVVTNPGSYSYKPTATLTITDPDGTVMYSAELCTGTPVLGVYTDTADELSTYEPGETYTVTVTASNNWGGSITITDTIDKAWAAMHITRDGYGVGLGMFSTGTEAAPRVDVGYPLYCHAGIEGMTDSGVYDVTQDVVVGKYIDSTGTYDVKRHSYYWSGTNNISANGSWWIVQMIDTSKTILHFYGMFQLSSGQIISPSYMWSTSSMYNIFLTSTGGLQVKILSSAAVTAKKVFAYVDYVDN